MKIQTFSVVVGGKKCNASCPYCVSKMTKHTGLDELEIQNEIPNRRNFRKACKFAQMSDVSTVLLTGVGEPLLYPALIKDYLTELQAYEFPFIELQTNGIELFKFTKDKLKVWYNMGLSTICISIAHYDPYKNKKIFGKNWQDLGWNIRYLHELGFAVRLSCVMCKNYIDSPEELKALINYCKEYEVEQLTARPVTNNIDISNGWGSISESQQKVYNWAQAHQITECDNMVIQNSITNDPKTTKLLELMHGAAVYDYDGQNISLNTCLTRSDTPNEVRQLIYSNDGHLRYDWEKKGAILI